VNQRVDDLLAETHGLQGMDKHKTHNEQDKTQQDNRARKESNKLGNIK